MATYTTNPNNIFFSKTKSNITTKKLAKDAIGTNKGLKKISIALQGGGAHGAFTWGVLHKLVEDSRLEIEAISGTSAGAMNAVVLANGMAKGGREGALRAMFNFWKRTSEAQRFSLMQPSTLDKALNNGRLDFSPSYHAFDVMSLMFSPYQSNLVDYNPLQALIEEVVDFEAVRRQQQIKLYISATNVKTSRVRVFNTEEVTAQTVMASACLPFVFKAVEIDGEAYWDGGFMGNPPIFPLIDGARNADILLVQINPINIPEIPKTAEEIRDRVNELSFNSSLMHEMRRVNFVQRMIEDGYTMNGVVRDLRVHNINPEASMAALGASSKLNADWPFLCKLHALGYTEASKWLDANFDKIGYESTCDVKETFL